MWYPHEREFDEAGLAETGEPEEEYDFQQCLQAGMCPFCHGWLTAPVESQYQAVATRYCSECGETYAAEW